MLQLKDFANSSQMLLPLWKIYKITVGLEITSGGIWGLVDPVARALDCHAVEVVSFPGLCF